MPRYKDENDVPRHRRKRGNRDWIVQRRYVGNENHSTIIKSIFGIERKDNTYNKCWHTILYGSRYERKRDAENALASHKKTDFNYKNYSFWGSSKIKMNPELDSYEFRIIKAGKENTDG